MYLCGGVVCVLFPRGALWDPTKIEPGVLTSLVVIVFKRLLRHFESLSIEGNEFNFLTKNHTHELYYGIVL